MAEFIQSLQQAFRQDSKSTVLKSLGWLISILSTATIFASRYGLDKWLVVMFAILDCIVILIYIAAYIYFAIKDPEQLRSEKFSIQKMAIQHGYVGDDLAGFFKVVKIDGVPLIGDSKPAEKGKEDK